jgi:TnpA family transposase
MEGGRDWWLQITEALKQVEFSGSLASLVTRADQTIDTEQIAEQWDRMGQLYASLKTGHVTASVALKRLVGFSAKNRLYRANRDLGRIFKTEFILQYLSEPELRRRIRRGLLKVEQLHALARDVFYGRRGRINARELWEQMNTCSCLNLILACIVYWQASEISRVLSSATRSPMGSISRCWNTSAPSSGITSCSTASISSIESSSASAVAQKGSSLAYKITPICLVP